MSRSKLWLIALLAGFLVVVLPGFIPAGPTARFDAAGLFESGRFLVGLSVTLLAGLLTALTPCVYPLIPITVSVFGARQAESRGKSLLLTSAYVVGMGVVFSALGVGAAKSGQAFGTVLGNPWVAFGLAVFLLALASSMFGAFDLNLPPGLAQWVNGVGGAGLVGAFLMGSVSGLLTAPCTGPVLTGLLTFVAKSQNTALGAALLFVYALGIGIPFFLIGVFAVRLPRGGAWMEWVKSIFGIALVALAISYLKDAFPAGREAVAKVGAQLGRAPGAAIAGGLTALGILLGAVHLSFKEDLRQFAFKALGVGVVAVALLLRMGALDSQPVGKLWVSWGLQKPLAGPELVWQVQAPNHQSFAQLEQSILQAKAQGRPVMIDFSADWCAACKELDRLTYVAPEVISESSRFLTIKVDATEEVDAITALYDRFGVKGLPTVAFVSSSGEVLGAPRVTGFLDASSFLQELKKVR